jgi:hypothetical protein
MILIHQTKGMLSQQIKYRNLMTGDTKRKELLIEEEEDKQISNFSKKKASLLSKT